MFLSKRNGTFYLCYLSDVGIERRVSTKSKTKRDALIFLRSFKEMEHERTLALQRKLFSDFTDDYLLYSKTIHTPSTTESCGAALREFVRVVGNRPLQSIGVRDIERFLATKREEASDWTARRCYVTLASAFEKAKKWNLIMENPFRKVEKPKVREIAPAYFTLEQFQNLLTFIVDLDFKELCILASTTGMRLSEISALKWNDIDFARRTILVQNSATFTTKSKRNRVIPISNSLLKVLLAREERMNSECELVFYRQRKRLLKDYISKNFKRYVVLAKVDQRLHFHSLRHSFASWLVQDGVSIYAVKELLGHSDVKTTQVYSHLQPDQLHSTVNRLNVSLN